MGHTTTLKEQGIMSSSSSSVQKHQASIPQKRMSLGEILDLLPGILSISVVGIIAFLTGPFRARKQKRNPKQGIAKTLVLHVGYALLRKATVRLSLLQMQSLVPSTKTSYKLYTWGHGLPQQTVELGYGGALGHWIGNKDAKNVLVWYHGGGFAVPANRGYFQFLHNLIDEMNKAGKDISVFTSSYTLTPHATYPTQLIQAVAAVRHVLQTERGDLSPSNVYLGGDSAGGNLVLGVLSHISHPHPEIEPLTIPEKFGGAVLLAPWTYLETDFPPPETDPLGDLITREAAKLWATAYLRGRQRDYYTDASLAPAEWWADLKVNDILILGGSNEILLPVIEKFTEKLTAGFPAAKLYIGDGECHIAPIMNLFLGDRTETEQGKRMKAWLRELLA